MIEVSQAPDSKWTEAMQNVYSQFGEDGLLKEVFRRIGTTNRQCFEVGGADGKWFSNTRRLIDEGWRAVLIEAEERNWPELEKLERATAGRVTAVGGKAEAVGENSLDAILDRCKLDERPDLGVIDVDGQDYYLWNGMLKFRPRVVVIEYDPAAPSHFVPDLNGEGQASFAAVCSVAVSKGYFNAATTATNAIFVHRSEIEKFFAEENLPDYTKVRPAGFNSTTGKLEFEDIPEAKAPVIATGTETEVKIAALLSRPRFGLNVFWDCASEALAPWHIPIRSFYGVFWGQCMQQGMREALDEGIDWILTLDYDSLFTSQHVQQLIDALGQHPEIDAIAALQVRRGRPLPLAVRSDGTMPLTGGPVKVRTAHFGLTLFRAEALRKLKKPWLWSTPTPSGDWGEGRLDEDIYFWGNWGDNGNSLYVHTGCNIGHVEEMVAYYDGTEVKHDYITAWRQRHGHSIKSFE